MFPDNACKREIQRLEVRCRYAKNNGCPWTGTLSSEDVHYITCEYRDEQCPECGNYMMWTKLKKHAELECPMRLTVCRFCSESLPVSHEKVCYNTVDYLLQLIVVFSCTFKRSVPALSCHAPTIATQIV